MTEFESPRSGAGRHHKKNWNEEKELFDCADELIGQYLVHRLNPEMDGIYTHTIERETN